MLLISVSINTPWILKVTLSPSSRLASFLKPMSKDIGMTAGLFTFPIHSPSIKASDGIKESL
jgi:hypothetical protein